MDFKRVKDKLDGYLSEGLILKWDYQRTKDDIYYSFTAKGKEGGFWESDIMDYHDVYLFLIKP